MSEQTEVPRYYGQGMTPHCCPVCHGKGIVPRGFYQSVNFDTTTSDATPEECKACSGQGVLWR